MPIGHNLSAFDALPGTALKWTFRVKDHGAWRWVAQTRPAFNRFPDDFAAALTWFLQAVPSIAGLPVEITREALGPEGKSTLKYVSDEKVAA